MSNTDSNNINLELNSTSAVVLNSIPGSYTTITINEDISGILNQLGSGSTHIDNTFNPNFVIDNTYIPFYDNITYPAPVVTYPAISFYQPGFISITPNKQTLLSDLEKVMDEDKSFISELEELIKKKKNIKNKCEKCCKKK